MLNLNTSPDLPFIMRGGQSKEASLYNRIAAIDRMNYLVRQSIPNFDIRIQSEAWRRCWELEMYKRFYVNDPKHPIDEDFCQKGAKVAIEMEGKPIKKVDQKEYMQAFMASAGDKPPENKEGFMANLLKKIKGFK